MADTVPTGSASPETPPPAPSAGPAYAPEQEVRFAVVMYGGVSLAVYINGVAQEMLRLVRATAPASPTSQDPKSLRLSDQAVKDSSMAVYRKLGQMLGRTNQTAAATSPAAPVRTRFVVDIVSGTSAGGINAVFLAKALANDQDMEGIKRLWKEQADLARLLNDGPGNKGLGVTPQNPPTALLSSARIYRDLLDALEQMEEPGKRTAKGETRSPFADEIDVFLTATDLWGLTLPIRLADKVVYERRYRNVFHFRYATDYAAGEERNDFHAGNHPFLAFAARCTSAFPFAFEPMTLADIDDSLRSAPPFGRDKRFLADSPEWKQFFKDYDQADGTDVTARPFGDGGYLDNYPFSYAIDTLQRRSADFPVVRKMLYVEPSPGHPEREREQKDRPDFFDNVLKALVEIPRAETIREDLQRTLNRNQLIERLSRITMNLEKDVLLAQRPEAGHLTGEKWAGQDLAGMIGYYGAGYGAYHRLKVYSVTDDVTRTVTRLATGLADASDQFLAVRYLVRAWRESRYVTYLDPDQPAARDASAATGGAAPLTQNRFLLDFDLGYRLRRLNFVRRKADKIYRMDDEAGGLLKAAGVAAEWPGDDAQAAFRRTVIEVKRGLTIAFVSLRRVERALNEPDPAAPNPALLTAIQKIAQNIVIPGKPGDDGHPTQVQTGLTPDALLALLSPCTEAAREQNAAEIVDDPKNAPLLQAFADELARQLGQAFKDASDRVRDLLVVKAGMPAAEAAVRQALGYYYDHFDAYDMVTFPTIYGTGVGEPVQVEVHRVSPEDAILPFTETEERMKLAGTSFGHFGSFLQRFWRVNDMLWGRLDGAERIIRAVTPHLTADEQKPLIDEAQRAIINEEIRHEDLLQIVGELVTVMMQAEGQQNAGGRSNPPNITALRKFVSTLPAAEQSGTLQAFLQSCLTDKLLVEYLGKDYEVDRRLVPEPAIRLAARSAATIRRRASSRQASSARGAAGEGAGAFQYGAADLVRARRAEAPCASRTMPS